MSASSSQCRSLEQVLETWGLARLAESFKRADIDLSTFIKLDETTARSILTPGAFLSFWDVFCARKAELSKVSNKRKRSSESVDEECDNPFSLSDDEADEDEDEDEDISVPDELVAELRSLISSTFIGEIILETKYEDRTESDRNRIAEIVVTEELRKTKPVATIDRKKLILLSKALEKIFDNEDKLSFYIPYKKVNNTVYAAKGKLTSQYYYWRQKGIAAGLIHSLHSTREKSTTTILRMAPEAEQSVKWLNVNLGPLSSVLEHWRATYTYRMALLDVARVDKISIPEYYSKFPVLRQPEAVILFKQDYETLYKGTENNLELNFKKFAEKLLLKLKKNKDLSKSWITKLNDYLESGLGVSVCHHFFSSLFHLFTPQVVVRGRKPNNWTATKVEMQMGFLTLLGSDAELEKHIDRRVTRLQSFKKPLGFTPFPAIIGNDLLSIEKCYVIVQPNDRYIVDSPQEAIDATFKAYHSLCVEYPPECKTMWLLVQQKIYNLYTPL